MDRRRFLLTSLAGVIAAPLASEAQQAGKVYRLGILTLGAAGPRLSPYWQPFIDEMRKRGYELDRNLLIKYSGADADPERLPGLAAHLVNEGVDVIVTTAIRETRAAQAATTSIPIVMTLVPDPVGAGLVPILARPGGNVTGLTTLVPGLYQKYVEFLHEVIPSATRFAIVVGLAPGAVPQKELAAAGKSLGVTIFLVHISGPRALEDALVQARNDGAAGIIVTPDVLTQMHSQQFVELALKHRVPGVYWAREYVDHGGLMSYSANYTELRRRAAHYVVQPSTAYETASGYSPLTQGGACGAASHFSR